MCAPAIVAVVAVVVIAQLGVVTVRPARADGDRVADGVAVASAVKRAAGTSREDDAECRAAQRDWSDAAVAARTPFAGLEECLAIGTPACGADLAAVRAAMAELSSHQQRIAWACRSRR